MERHTNPTADVPKWSALLVEAVNKPGLPISPRSDSLFVADLTDVNDAVSHRLNWPRYSFEL